MASGDPADPCEKEVSDLKSQLEKSQKVVARWKQKAGSTNTDLQLANLKLEQLKGTSLLQNCFSVFVAVLIGFGTTWVTANPPNQAGWLVLAIAVFIQLMIFLMGYLAKH